MGKIWNLGRFTFLSAVAYLCLGVTPPASGQSADTVSPSQTEMKAIVAGATERVSRWNGPTTGPAAMKGVQVAVVCEDLRNGGVLGVARGVGEAARILDWKVRMFDAHGTSQGRRDALTSALSMKPDGVILLGSDSYILEPHLSRFAKSGIPLVGWHVGPVAGKLSSGSVAMNVSTDPLEVARVTAMAALVESDGKAGVIIFTDTNFEIAMRKANAMADVIRTCGECELLEMRRLPISQTAQRMPDVTRELLEKYGKRWTHALAINDIYFDYAAPVFTREERDIHLFSAGDGSPAAFLRIQAGTFQYGTVAEPLNLHGWQLLDELNRLLAGKPVSGYIMPVHLVTPENIAFDGGPQMMFDPDNGYREAYRRIWKR